MGDRSAGALEGVDVQWDVGPFTGRGGEYFEWFVEVPPDARVLPDQTSYLSDLLIRVILRVDGVEVQRASPGYLRVAFSDESEPLVMLPTQAEDLAPGGAWASTATPRSSSADLADVERPPPPVDEASSQHSEEVDG